MEYLVIYLVIINILAFIIYGIDKKKAISVNWRIPESTLLLYSIIGGGIGSMIGMKMFRHKTQKLKFKVGVPFLTLVSVVVIYYVYITFFA